jgi:hypothetical protein
VYEQPTRRTFGPTLITVLIMTAVVFGIAGYYGTKAYLDAGNTTPLSGPSTGSTRTNPPPTTQGSTAATTTPAAPPTTSDAPVTTTSAAPPDGPAGDPSTCPAQTITAIDLKGFDDNLKVELYVEVKLNGGGHAEAWVCSDTTGKLYYQGHVLRGLFTRADDGAFTILLGDGVKGTVEVEDGGYVATNVVAGKTTVYHVSKTGLRVENPDGTTSTFAAVRSAGA